MNPSRLLLELEVDLPRAERCGSILGTLAQVGDLLILEGDLGTGKTTFAGSVVHGAGVPEAIAVTSPTFALLNEYQGRIPLVHGDLYRLDHALQLRELDLSERLQSNFLLLEWAARFADDIATTWLCLTFSFVEERHDVRHLRIESSGRQQPQWCADWLEQIQAG